VGGSGSRVTRQRAKINGLLSPNWFDIYTGDPVQDSLELLAAFYQHHFMIGLDIARRYARLAKEIHDLSQSAD
jgi:hypothetical protein